MTSHFVVFILIGPNGVLVNFKMGLVVNEMVNLELILEIVPYCVDQNSIKWIKT